MAATVTKVADAKGAGAIKLTDTGAFFDQTERITSGRNWRRLVGTLSEKQISTAQESLKRFLEVDNLKGLSFLDVGCGNGLFSLAARLLCAEVLSFDDNKHFIGCTQELRDRYFRGDPFWRIMKGSVLDQGFLSSLGAFDIVYAWGVLHHTGKMWNGLENCTSLVKPRGKLLVSLYNDQGRKTQAWRAVKRVYSKAPPPFGFIMAASYFGYRNSRNMYKKLDMLRWRDVADWIKRYPFEVAKPEAVTEFLAKRAFRTLKVLTPPIANVSRSTEYLFQRV